MHLSLLEKLQDIASLQNIEIGRFNLPKKVRGLYYEEGTFRSITINSDVTTITEEADVLAEEIGHSVVGGGDLFFPDGTDPVLKRKAELRAKAYAYNLLVPVKRLIEVIKEKTCIYDIAEELNVTETFVKEAMDSYKIKGLVENF